MNETTLRRRPRADVLVTVAAAMFAVAPVNAAETPFFASVGDDDHPRNDLFVAPVHRQFQYSGPHDDAPEFFTVFDSRGVEGRGFTPRPNVCLLSPLDQIADQFPAQLLAAGFGGSYSWGVGLPMRPTGNIEVELQCGLLKPNTEGTTVTHPLLECAGETGERIGDPGCTRLLDQPGTNPVRSDWLPTLNVSALNERAAIDFHMTAFRQPGPFELDAELDGSLRDSTSLQLLDGGSRGARVALQACLRANITLKTAVSGQINAFGEEEVDLERGDLIALTMNVPRGHSMDMYCSANSMTVLGTGNPLTATGARRRPSPASANSDED